MAERGATYGWERWPDRWALDFSVKLCRWDAKPLAGRQTAYCSDECRREIEVRCRLAELRRVIFKRDGGCCARCGINLVDLEFALEWYSGLRLRLQFAKGVPLIESNRVYALIAHWPDIWAVREALGFKSGGHLWEMNHKIALAEGGDPVDPENLETLCLRCHRDHTGQLAGRLAKAKRREKKFHNGGA